MLYLYDDAVARTFEPFASTRPAGELRAGAELVRRRWAHALGTQAVGFIGASHLDDFEEFDAPLAAARVVDGGVLPAGAVVANARCAVRLDGHVGPAAHDVTAWSCEGRTAAVRLAAPVPLSSFTEGVASLDDLPAARGTRATLGGWWMDAVWDYIRHLQPMLGADVAALGPALGAVDHPGTVIGSAPVYVERGATVEPYVVFDTTAGPVLVRRGATVQAFTRVVGPCYVGQDSTVVADRVSGCSIGEVSRVHGEISASVVLGHANKSHDGFVGHSYLGRWCNLGAGTTTSNLKNTYGTVALWTPGGMRDTGMQFLGTLFGDHARTGIGLLLTTGSVVGAGANVYDRMPPKFTPPFSWGGTPPYAAYDVDRFVRVAERAMARRQVTLGAAPARVLRAAHARAAAWRAGAGTGGADGS